MKQLQVNLPDALVQQVLACEEVGQLLLTFNVPERLMLPDDSRLVVIENSQPRGFGANHNEAFAQCQSQWFVVLNPDVTLQSNPFPELLRVAAPSDVALVSPRATTALGTPEDCWRRFPTVYGLIRKWWGLGDGRYEHPSPDAPAFAVEWVSGLCMCFRSEAYAALNGFDEGFFLYYEDVDICARAWRMGMRVLACPAAALVHDGRRASRLSFLHKRWHLKSMLRYFAKHWCRLPRGGGADLG